MRLHFQFYIHRFIQEHTAKEHTQVRNTNIQIVQQVINQFLLAASIILMNPWLLLAFSKDLGLFSPSV